jgi:hypothetical protein
MGSNPGEIKTFFFHAAVMLFYITQRITFRNFVFSEIHNHASLYGPIASDASVDPALEVCSSAMLV